MGDLNCDICHPSVETLQAEGYPRGRKNLAPAPTVGRHIAPPRKEWDMPSSDLSGRVDDKTVLFGDDA